MAYAELLERYRGGVHYTMLKMTQNPEDADDLTMEAFGKAFRNLSDYTPNYSFSTWLFKIATNNGVDFLRRKRMELLSLEEALEEKTESIEGTTIQHLASDDLDPEEQFILEQRQYLMRELLLKISDKYRTIIELRFFEQLAYHEISERLDLPIGTIKSNIYRAKELLYDILSNSRKGL